MSGGLRQDSYYINTVLCFGTRFAERIYLERKNSRQHKGPKYTHHGDIFQFSLRCAFPAERVHRQKKQKSREHDKVGKAELLLRRTKAALAKQLAVGQVT